MDNLDKKEPKKVKVSGNYSLFNASKELNSLQKIQKPEDNISMKNALIGEEYLDPSDRDKNVNKVLKFLNENMENDLKDVDKENLVPDPTISFNEIKEEYK